jgi:hypothetical protein
MTQNLPKINNLKAKCLEIDAFLKKVKELCQQLANEQAGKQAHFVKFSLGPKRIHIAYQIITDNSRVPRENNTVSRKLNVLYEDIEDRLVNIGDESREYYLYV